MPVRATVPARRAATPRRPAACTLALALATVCGLCGACVALAQPAATAATAPEPKRNWFDDPFFQASAGLPGCPAPEGPMYTEAERRSQMHARLERGTSCWLAGHCADSNAYRYDPRIAPRVRDALARVRGARRASVWVMVQRRWVYLQGCVPDRALAARLERAARAVPDVERVVNDLMPGTRGRPSYPVAPAAPAGAPASRSPETSPRPPATSPR